MSAAWKVVRLVYSTFAMSVAAKASIKVGRKAELMADEKGVKTGDKNVAMSAASMVSVMVG